MTDLSTLLNRHRSIRSYKVDPIPAALVEQVLGDAVAGSSSSGNLNSYSMVLTRDPERKQRLYTLHFEQDMILEAPLLITFCADWYRTREWLRRRGARDNFGNLIGWHVAAFDAMILSQSVCLGFEAAPRRDLGGAEARIETRLEEQHALALLAVVVRDREQVHRLRRIHGAVPEVELRHGRHSRKGI